MPAHAIACIIYSCNRSEGFEIWHLSVLSRGKNLLFFVKKTCLFLTYAPCSTVPVASFTVSHRCSFTEYRTREYEVEQVPIYTSRRKKLKRKKVINKPLNSSKMVIVLRSIHRVEKYTFKTWKATEMYKYIFVMVVFVSGLKVYFWL